MKRTVEEKYQYNKRRKGSFSSGYCYGVSLYRDYPKHDEEGKMLTQALVNVAKVRAREGQQFSKGLLCGYRDKANERKEKLSFTGKQAPRRGDHKQGVRR